MKSVRILTLVGLALLCMMLTVQADDGDNSDENTSDKPRHPSGDDHFGYKDDDDDDDYDKDCDDDDDDYKMGEKGRMGDDMHHKKGEKDHDGDSKEDGDKDHSGESKEDKDEYNEHSKRKQCHRKKIAKILIIVGASIAVIGTGVGLAICCVRHKRQRMRSVSESKTNLHVPGGRENVYVVAEVPTAPEKKPSALDFPVVSHAPLPGKE
ncbi:pheromone-processing carboxypeptidase KEX1-like [Pecten maximus]|uniref:pheromone-processing carboxypeptidase KEX1-like n=1 Tax=Pecten maximus TaxID=6579 RepID=UPI0014585950|nr:pheromone-processing carboxypeptidase KEX1-like [Pecten maximus]